MKPDALPNHPATMQTGGGVVAPQAGKHYLLLVTLGLYVVVLPIAHTIVLQNVAFLGLLALTLALLIGVLRSAQPTATDTGAAGESSREPAQ